MTERNKNGLQSFQQPIPEGWRPHDAEYTSQVIRERTFGNEHPSDTDDSGVLSDAHRFQGAVRLQGDALVQRDLPRVLETLQPV